MVDQKCVVEQDIVCLIDQQHSLSLHLSFECKIRSVNFLLDIEAVQCVQECVHSFVDTHQQLRAVKYGEVCDVVELGLECDDACDDSRLPFSRRYRDEDSTLLIFM